MSARELASVDGRIVPTAEATVPLKDDGLYRGDGAFEVIRLYAGRPFALGEHLDRIQRSATAIELAVDRPALERDLDALLAENGDADAQLRIVLTRGGRRLAMIEPLVEHAPSVSLATVDYSTTLILDRVKSLSYAANMQATRLAKNADADEALLILAGGTVLEAPTSTIFWSTDGALRTPSLELPILDSITRDRLVRELEVEESEYPLDDLLSADEAFLASTVREVQPISRVDDRDFGPEGGLTRQARETYAALVSRELG